MPERHVWLELAPHAVHARTLTKATSLSFRLLCANVVLERVLAGDDKRQGGSNHRGMIQRIDLELARFCLAPYGKPLYEPSGGQHKPINPLARFLDKARKP